MKVSITYDDTLYQLVPIEDLREIVLSIRQHIAQGVASEAFESERRPGYGTGIYTYLKHKMDSISTMLSSAPTPPSNPADRKPLTLEQIKLAIPDPCIPAIDIVRATEAAHGITAPHESILMQGIRCPNANDEQCRYPDCKCHG